MSSPPREGIRPTDVASLPSEPVPATAWRSFGAIHIPAPLRRSPPEGPHPGDAPPAEPPLAPGVGVMRRPFEATSSRGLGVPLEGSRGP
jgi:hypothetical protein